MAALEAAEEGDKVRGFLEEWLLPRPANWREKARRRRILVERRERGLSGAEKALMCSLCLRSGGRPGTAKLFFEPEQRLAHLRRHLLLEAGVKPTHAAAAALAAHAFPALPQPLPPPPESSAPIPQTSPQPTQPPIPPPAPETATQSKIIVSGVAAKEATDVPVGSGALEPEAAESPQPPPSPIAQHSPSPEIEVVDDPSPSSSRPPPSPAKAATPPTRRPGPKGGAARGRPQTSAPLSGPKIKRKGKRVSAAEVGDSPLTQARKAAATATKKPRKSAPAKVTAPPLPSQSPLSLPPKKRYGHALEWAKDAKDLHLHQLSVADARTALEQLTSKGKLQARRRGESWKPREPLFAPIPSLESPAPTPSPAPSTTSSASTPSTAAKAGGKRRRDSAKEGSVGGLRLPPSKGWPRRCALCSVEVEEAEVNPHVYTSHIRKPIVCCPVDGCSFCSSYDVASVKEHVRREHPNNTLAIKDSRLQYVNELRQITAEAGLL